MLTNETGSSSIVEIAGTSFGLSSGGIQGVAYDPTGNSGAGSVWVAGSESNTIYEMTRAGAALTSFSITAPNGIAYDSSRDALWVLNVTGPVVKRYSKAGAEVATLNVSNAGITTGADHLAYDAANDWLWITYGSSTGHAVAVEASTGAVRARYNLTESTSIEGIHVSAINIYISHDGYYHSTSPLLNRLQTFAR
jgi:hypothetical protein